MRILALDPSLVKTGWAVYAVAGGLARLVASGVVRPRTDQDEAWRLASLVAQVDEVVRAHLDPVHGIRHVVIERPPAFTYARSAEGAKALNLAAMGKLHLATGALVGWAAGVTPCVHLVEATTWKGRGRRALTKAGAQALAGTRSHDEADAIALGSWWVRIGHRLDAAAC